MKCQLVVGIVIPSLAVLGGACGGDAPADGVAQGQMVHHVGTVAQASISDPQQIRDIRTVNPAAGIIPVPAGYGTYCSLMNASGTFRFNWGGAGSDACAPYQNTGTWTVQRAGLWSVSHNNNAMVQCTSAGGFGLGMWYGSGDSALIAAKNGATGSSVNCVFTVAPFALPIWGSPIRLYDYTQYNQWGYSVYDGNTYKMPWSPTGSSQAADDLQKYSHMLCGPGQGTPGDAANKPCTTTANCDPGMICHHLVAWDQAACINPRCASVSLDRTGKETVYATSCGVGAMDGCNGTTEPVAFDAVEGAYDWSTLIDTPLIAMADGLVVGSQCRDWQDNGGGQAGNCQQELFIEHQVGTGVYAEHFVAMYHHMDWTGNGWQDPKTLAWSTLPPVGTAVHKGEQVGLIGHSGNAGSNHLDLSVVKLTNLTGARAYPLVPQNVNYNTCGGSAPACPLGYGCQLRNSPSTNCATQGTNACDCVSGWGVNGGPGIIDPFGWAGVGVEPQAWMFIGLPSSATYSTVTPGAYSINLFATPAPGEPVIPPTVGPTVQ